MPCASSVEMVFLAQHLDARFQQEASFAGRVTNQNLVPVKPRTHCNRNSEHSGTTYKKLDAQGECSRDPGLRELACPAWPDLSPSPFFPPYSTLAPFLL